MSFADGRDLILVDEQEVHARMAEVAGDVADLREHLDAHQLPSLVALVVTLRVGFPLDHVSAGDGLTRGNVFHFGHSILSVAKSHLLRDSYPAPLSPRTGEREALAGSRTECGRIRTRQSRLMVHPM